MESVAQRTIPEFPLLLVGAMMLTAAVSAVAFWAVRAAGLFFWWSARSWTPSKCKLSRLETKHYGPLLYTYRRALPLSY